MYPEIRVFNVTLSSYLLLYAFAIAVMSLIVRRELKRYGYPSGHWAYLMIVGIAAGFVGSKLYFILVAWDGVILGSWRTYFSTTGTGWYGGLFLGVLAVAAALRITKTPVVRTLDVIIPAMPIGQILGRLGCFMAGCCRGAPASVPWAVAFPDEKSLKVHPAQLYEIFGLVVVTVPLWALRDKELREGMKVGFYLIMAGFVRFLVELYRPNARVVSFLTVPQVWAILEIGIGLLFMLNPSRRAPVVRARSDIGGGGIARV